MEKTERFQRLEFRPGEVATITDQPLMTFKSHTSGKNADARIYVDRIEWDRKDLLSTGGKKVLGVATGGISLLKTGLQEASDREVIPVSDLQHCGRAGRVPPEGQDHLLGQHDRLPLQQGGRRAGQEARHRPDARPPRVATAAARRSAEDRQVDRPPPTSTPKPAGWYRDPGGKVDHRYFDGKWTDHVANEGDENTYIDPVPR